MWLCCWGLWGDFESLHGDCLLFINIGKEKKNLFSKVRTKVTGSALVFIFLRTLSWWIRTWLVIFSCFTEELPCLKRKPHRNIPSPPFLLPDRNPLSWAPFLSYGAVLPETSRIFHLWLKWTSSVWDPWLWVKSPNCLLMLPKPTNALKYRDIPQVLGSVRTSVGLSHSVRSSTLQTLTSLFTTLVLWTWEAVRSSSIHNSAQDFFF